MPQSKIRFITACQQLLALALVLAALTPAASVVSLDVVREHPGARGGMTISNPGARLSAYARETARPSRVPTGAVDPTVREHALTAARGAAASARATAAANVAAVRTSTAAARTVARATKAGLAGAGHPAAEVTGLTSTPQPVSGYGAVGVTWAHGVRIPASAITLRVRTRTGATWTRWMDLAYDDDHGPDAGSPEAARARPGSDALLVGDVDDVQVRVDADRALPPDLRLAVVDPGHAARSASERPALDTGTTTAPGATEAADVGAGGAGGVGLRAATYTPRPQIYSRAQWGADEGMRDKSSLRYFEVHAGFVHHTVNANDYTRDEVPGIIRSIYAYHTKSRGWSDIGYNFLVDRFGRIWEGRYGGIDRPVVGAHTLGYNDYAFAMSAIGNYDVKQPSDAIVQAYGALFAWKLSLHGVDAASTSQRVGSRDFQAINGHRDAASTACPGRFLYARIPAIRRLAAAAQRGWAGRERESDLVATDHPDLLLRRASDGRVFVLPTGGMTSFRPGSAVASGLPRGSRPVVTPDVTGDGLADVVVVLADGTAQVRPGTATGTFAAPLARVLGRFADRDLVTAAGDLDGDGRNDLVARSSRTHALDVYLGRGNGTFRLRHLTTRAGGYRRLAATGDVTGDGRADLVALARDARLWVLPGTGAAAFGARRAAGGSWSGVTTLTGYGDLTADGRGDLLVRRGPSGAAYVAPARGDGTFGHLLGPVPGLAGIGAVAGAVQLVGDRAPELVHRTGSTLGMRVDSGTTETRPRIRTNVVARGATALLNAGDWDRDGRGDLVLRDRAGHLLLRRGDGRGRFTAATTIASGFSGVRLLSAVGDMTGDGYPDLMGQPRGRAMRIYPGRGTAGLATSYVAHAAIRATTQAGVGRWTGDGAPDSLLVRDGRVTLYPGNGPGGLTRPRAVAGDLSRYDGMVGVSDADQDGHADVVVRERATGYLWLLPGTSSGFGPRRFLAEGTGGYDLAG